MKPFRQLASFGFYCVLTCTCFPLLADEYEGEWAGNRGSDIFVLIPQETKQYNITLSSKMGDAFLRLQSSAGDLVLDDNDSAGGTNAQIVTELQAGRGYYVIATTANNSKQGQYLLSLSDGELAPCFQAYDDVFFQTDNDELDFYCAGFNPAAVNELEGEDDFRSISIPRNMRVTLFENRNREKNPVTLFTDVEALREPATSASSAEFSRFKDNDFAMVVISDTQFPRTHCNNPGNNNDRRRAFCDQEIDLFNGGSGNNREASDFYNTVTKLWVDRMHSYFGETQFGGVIINGDLTEDGDHVRGSLQHPVFNRSDLDQYKDIWGIDSLYNVYPGLGNHDYENRVDDCSPLFETNFCAHSMIEYFVDEVIQSQVLSIDYAVIDGETTGSLAYSYNIGDVHFVQLNNFPSFEISFTFIDWFLAGTFVPGPFGVPVPVPVSFPNPLGNHTTNILPSLAQSNAFADPAASWLIRDLEQAKQAGKTIVLNMHDLGSSTTADFYRVLNEYPVSAIFAGHLHNRLGYYQLYNAGNKQVPAFYSGAAFDGSMLVTRYVDNQLHVFPLQIDLMDIDASEGTFYLNTINAFSGNSSINLNQLSALQGARPFQLNNELGFATLDTLFELCEADSNGCDASRYYTMPLIFPDEDFDGVIDKEDNCTHIKNFEQKDTDNDGYGNACDADLNNDTRVDMADFQEMRSHFYSSDANADLNDDGRVNFIDLGILRSFMGTNMLEDDVSPSKKLQPSPVRFSFYSETNAVNQLCTVELSYESTQAPNRPSAISVDFVNSRDCNNDEASSVVIRDVPQGARFAVFDKRCNETLLDDDYSAYEVLRPVSKLRINSFETDINNANVRSNYEYGGNLNNKVSCLRYYPLGNDPDGVFGF